MKTRIAGIPCKVRVIHFTPRVPAQLTGLPENCYPEEGGEIEFTVLDRKGYRAPWIEKKLTKDDVERIEREYEVYAEAIMEAY